MPAMNKMTEKLTALAALMQVTLDDEQAEKLLAHLRLLAKWNKAYNLTAITDPDEQLTHHTLDSLAVTPYIIGQRIIDVGTGGGFPGIPLAIVKPEIQWTLLDSNSKKTRFLTQVIHELALDNVSVVHARLEQYRTNEGFDAMISRAFAAPEKCLGLGESLVKPGGCFFFMQGQVSTAGIEAQMQCRTQALTIPGLEASRHLVIAKRK
jgi:16S rRNA (guanine527-N7)-methyltransferase